MKNFIKFFAILSLTFASTTAMAEIPDIYSVSPEQGVTVSEISTITITYAKPTNPDMFGASVWSKSFTINGKEYKGNSNPSLADFTSYNTGTYDETWVLTLKEPITDPGDYTISFAKGFFYYDIVEDLPALSWTIKVSKDTNPDIPSNPDQPSIPETSIPQNFVVNPTSGSIISELKTFSVKYTGEISSYDEFIGNPFTMKFKIDGKEYGPLLPGGNDGSGPFKVDYVGPREEEVVFTLSEPITSLGIHTIEFPKGYFSFYESEYKFDAVVWSVIIEDDNKSDYIIPAGFLVEPENGSSVININHINVTSYEYTNLNPVQSFNIFIDGKEVEAAASISSTQSNTISYILSDPITDLGTHTVEIPAGAFTYYDNEKQLSSEAFSFSLIVIGELAQFEPIENPGVEIDPVQGEYSSLVKFHLTFYGASYYPDLDFSKPIYLKNEVTGENVCQLFGDDGGAFTDIYLVLPEPVIEKGHYILDIPAGAITDYDGNEMAAMKFRYWVDGSGVVEIPQEKLTANPADGATVGSLSEILLTFPDIEEVYADGPNRDEVLVTCNEQVVDTKVSFYFDSSIADFQIYMTFSPALTKEGEYEIHVPESVFSLCISRFEQRWNEQFTLHYSVAPDMEIIEVTPANASSLESFDNLNIKFASAVELSSVENISAVIGKMKNGEIEGEKIDCDWTGKAVSSIEYDIVPDRTIYIPKGENLYIMLPAGMFVLENNILIASDALTLVYIGSYDSGVELLNQEEDVEYYNIGGIRVTELVPGNLYIIRKANVTGKFIAR